MIDIHIKNGKWKIETCFEHIGRIFLEHVKTTGHVKAISAIIKKRYIYNKCSKQCQCVDQLRRKKINEEICVCTDREHKFLTRNYHIKSC